MLANPSSITAAPASLPTCTSLPVTNRPTSSDLTSRFQRHGASAIAWSVVASSVFSRLLRPLPASQITHRAAYQVARPFVARLLGCSYSSRRGPSSVMASPTLNFITFNQDHSCLAVGESIPGASFALSATPWVTARTRRAWVAS